MSKKLIMIGLSTIVLPLGKLALKKISKKIKNQYEENPPLEDEDIITDNSPMGGAYEQSRE